ncbi:MAG: hypothetical protein QMC90_05735, partial [Dehalococcoidales bacterium]|nr:hypothetical protein [Dehalococcoidales bacterium]
GMSQTTRAMKATIREREEVDMPTWTVAFDSTFSVFDIEAETQEEAEKKAEEAIKGIDEVINEYINRGGESYGLWINKIYLVRNEDTRKEILK